MGNLTLNTIGIRKWFKDRGDYTHNINYDLNEDSKVIDIGGYTGVWSQQIIDKYNPNMYIIEPVPMFFDTLIDKFGDNPKVHLLNVGVSTRNKKGKLYEFSRPITLRSGKQNKYLIKRRRSNEFAFHDYLRTVGNNSEVIK